MSTIGLHEASRLTRCHPDTLRKMAKAREVPATKIGRSWVFSYDLLIAWINDRCRSTDVPAPTIGGSALAAKLAARRAQRTARKQKNSRSSSASDSGAGIGSGTAGPLVGPTSRIGGYGTPTEPARGTGSSSTG